MKVNFIKLFLTASLALNLAFAGPYLYRKIFPVHQPTRPSTTETTVTEPTRPLAPANTKTTGQTPLRREQRKELKTIINKFRFDLLKYKEDIVAKRIEIIEALSDPEFDPVTITTLAGELNKLESESNLLFVNTVIRISALLDVDQRLDFLSRLGNQWFFIAGNNKPFPAAGNGNGRRPGANRRQQ